MPWSKMVKKAPSLKAIPKSKQKQWYATYEDARVRGYSKESAAKMAHGAIKENMNNKSLLEFMQLNERDVLEHNAQLKNLLTQEVPSLVKKMQAALNEDRYNTLVDDLQLLEKAVHQSKLLLQQTLKSQGNKIQNKQAPRVNNTSPEIKDEEL